MSGTKKIGLALGGGGARGYAHIPLLEVLDAMDLRPSLIAGTSIGAIIGAIYASGMSGVEIRERVRKVVISRHHPFRDMIKKRDELFKWIQTMAPDIGGPGLIRSDRIMRRLLKEIRVERFEDLAIPLRVVATDLWSGQDVVFDQGDLTPALRASMAVPGVFAPVVHGGRVLVDGGMRNVVPYELLFDSCDVVIAVNIARWPAPRDPAKPPRLHDLLRHSIDLMQMGQFEEAMRRRQPDILIEPEVGDIGILQFERAQTVLERAQPYAELLRKELERVM